MLRNASFARYLPPGASESVVECSDTYSVVVRGSGGLLTRFS